MISPFSIPWLERYFARGSNSFRDKHSSLLGPVVSYKENKVCQFLSWFLDACDNK
jgi:hypothetical protein